MISFSTTGAIKDITNFSVDNFSGELPSSNYILTISDYNFYLKYGEKFIDSSISVGHTNTHLHVINPDGDIIERDGLTVTTSTLEVNDEYKARIASQRIFIWRNLLEKAPYAFWSFDIDGIFNSSFDFDCDGIGLYLRDDLADTIMLAQMKNEPDKGWDLHGNQTYCAIFYISPENVGYLDSVISDLHMSEMKWCVDQGSLYRAYAKCKKKYTFFQPEGRSINSTKWQTPHLYKFYHYGKGTE